MTTRYLTDLADVLRAAGLDVVEVPGWKTRGRPGTFEPKGTLCHHTGGKSDSYAYIEWMATVGRASEDPPLNPPLAQLGLSRKGTWYVMAAGRANHAGRCKPIAGLSAYPGRDYGDGNAQLVGVEAMNTGSEGWTPEQYDAYVRGVAAINRHYGWSIVLGHKETSLSGKPDPGGIDMSKFRDDVAAEGSEEEVTPENIKAIADEILGRRVVDAYGKDTTVGAAVGVTLRNSTAATLAARDAARDAAVARSLAEQQAAVGRPLTAEEIEAATAAGVERALSEAAKIEVVVKTAGEAGA